MSSNSGVRSGLDARVGDAHEAVRRFASVRSRTGRALFLLLAIASSPPVTAADITSSTAEDRRLFEQLLRPPSRVRAEVAETEEIRRELYLLQPPYTRLGVAVLHDLKRLEQRPEGPLEAWADALRRRYTSRAGMVVSLLVEAKASEPDLWPGGSDDETIVRSGGVQRRLIQLAISGRVSEQEYESFVRRLQGP